MSNYLRNPRKKAGLGDAAPFVPKPKPALTSTVALSADDAIPFQPAIPAEPASQILGDSGSSESLKRLLNRTDEIKQIDTLVLLKEALLLFKRGNWAGGGECALKALYVDEKSTQAWHILAIAREKCGDLKTSLTCYETALRLTPDDPHIANDLGRLAYRLGILDLAEKFFRFFLSRVPGHAEALNNLASVLREKNDLDGAVEMLQAAIAANPTDPQLWNAIGTVVNARGETDTAAVFYAEALKYDPNHCHALYNYGNVLATQGHIEEGLDYLKRALPLFVDPMNIHTCKLSIAFCYLGKGDLENGWTWYEARSKENTAEQIHYVVKKPRWKPGMPLEGQRVFVSAEQGLGDEIMFAGVINNLIREVGPNGHVGIGVEPRLVPLFQKGFPTCTVIRHHTTRVNSLPVRVFPDMPDWADWDCYALMADFLPRYRSTLESFAQDPVAFHPDPERVAYWKAMLNGLNDKPKVGILWKSAINHSRRNRYYSPFEDWKSILALDGIQFINLQYGDTTQELEDARAMGLDIWTPPGIDLKNDLDDLSALCAALDCVLGPANATSNIAGATGTRVWIYSLHNAWNSLGTDRFPWYVNTRVFFSQSLLDWQPVMSEIRDALVEEFIT